ncbi:MAG: hypothetical protein H6825_08910 [Planctomycetes bacterium]|nr:hypothetical protein [Planctomycetota bacterium]
MHARHAALGLLLGVACVVASTSAQDAPPPSAGDPGVASDGATPLPDPANWIVDPDRAPKVWLSKPPIDPDDLAARPEAYATMLATHGLALDLERRSVSVRGSTIHDLTDLGYPIEYPLVTEDGKTHEAVVVVRAKPSVLDACLRALGLRPGAPTALIEKDPLPPAEEIESGATSPYWLEAGYGPVVDIRVTWTDDDGRPHDEALESLLVDVNDDQPLDPLGWIYVGSRYGHYRQGRETVDWFKADVEGDVCAIYLEGLDVCLFERNSLDGLSYAPYTLNGATIPPRSTPVTLRITPRDEFVAPAERVDLGEFYERRAAEKAAEHGEGAPGAGSEGDERADAGADG